MTAAVLAVLGGAALALALLPLVERAPALVDDGFRGLGAAAAWAPPLWPLLVALAAALAATATLAGLGWAWPPVLVVLVVAAWIDWRHHLLPDVLTVPLAVGGLAAALGGQSVPPPLAAVGALVGAVVPGVIAWIRNRDDHIGLGWGDVKLCLGLGAWLGPVGVLAVILLSGLVMVPAHLLGRGRLLLPFGPALAVAAVAVALAAALLHSPLVPLSSWP